MNKMHQTKTDVDAEIILVVTRGNRGRENGERGKIVCWQMENKIFEDEHTLVYTEIRI